MRLRGADVVDVLPRVDVAELRAAAARMRTWAGAFTADAPAGLPNADAQPGMRAYATLLVCRALVAIDDGRQTSKQDAARVVAARFPQWRALADAAVAVKEGGEPTAALDADEAARFVAWAVDRVAPR